jgi:hypothetical protein
MGLFWSRAATPRVDGEIADDPMTLTLTAAIAGEKASASHRMRRSFRAEAVRQSEVRDDGLVARLFEPEGPRPHPAVMVVGGSGGGLQWSSETAALLASRGVVALAVAYFGLPGLPATLDRIPIEYFGRGLRFLQEHPSVDAQRIGIVGVSRGGELALLLGATYPAFRAVVAYVPSGVLWSGFPSIGHSAWTWNGRGVRATIGRGRRARRHPCGFRVVPAELRDGRGGRDSGGKNQRARHDRYREGRRALALRTPLGNRHGSAAGLQVCPPCRASLLSGRRSRHRLAQRHDDGHAIQTSGFRRRDGLGWIAGRHSAGVKRLLASDARVLEGVPRASCASVMHHMAIDADVPSGAFRPTTVRRSFLR